MKHIFLILLLIASGTALADAAAPDDNVARLQAELGKVEQEQQAVFRNYQMTKEARLNEVQEESRAGIQQPFGVGVDSFDMPLNSPPPNYDDVVRDQTEREQRIQQQTDELKKLWQRYLELESQRKSLQAQLRKLTQPAD
jgi:chromosome segregation ATPase